MTKSIPKIKSRSKGTLYAFLAVIPYSLIPLIFLVQYVNLPGTGIGTSMAKGAVNVVGKDLISGILFGILLAARNIKEKKVTFWKTLRSREGFYSGISGIFGGPIGYMLYNSAYYMAGASFTHIFTSVEPIILVIYATLMWKRKFKWQVWLGVVLAVVGVAGSIIGSSLGGTPWKAVIGSLLAIGGAASWSVESILMDRTFTYAQKNKTSVLDIMTVKMFIAILFNLIIMFPAMGAWQGRASVTYLAFGELFTNMDFIWRMFVAGFLIFAGRAWFFCAVKYRGATFSNVLYELTAILMPLIAFITYAISGYYPGVVDPKVAADHLGLTWQLEFWITSAFIVAGSILVIMYPYKIDRIKEHKKLKGSK